MSNTTLDIGVARQIGSYGDAVAVPANSRWLFTSGTPGLALDGALPDDIAGQAELAWRHIVEMLKRADMTTGDLVKVTHYLVRSDDIGAYEEDGGKLDTIGKALQPFAHDVIGNRPSD